MVILVEPGRTRPGRFGVKTSMMYDERQAQEDIGEKHGLDLTLASPKHRGG